jgi:anti-sigma regulatory factor (Ser/Thr protein kinase)
VSDRRTFPGRPASVRAARHFAVDALGRAPHAVVEAVAIAVSELATNCVLHARTDFSVEVARSGDRVRITVADAGSGEPVLRAPSSSESSGRGLLLVRELSDEWGVDTVDDRPGKSVWFALHVPVSDGATLQDADAG